MRFIIIFNCFHCQFYRNLDLDKLIEESKALEHHKNKPEYPEIIKNTREILKFVIEDENYDLFNYSVVCTINFF